MVSCWTCESKYDISIVKLDLRLHVCYSGVPLSIEARYCFTLGFSIRGVPFSVGTVCLDIHLPVTTVCGAHVILWRRNASCVISLLCGKYTDQSWVLSALLDLCVANPLITRLLPWQVVWTCAFFFHVSRNNISCWIYGRVYGDLRGHGRYVL